MAARSVPAIFHDRVLKQTVTGNVKLPATAGGSAQAAKLACSDYAWDNGYPLWAHEDPVSKEWLAFECSGRSSRIFLKRLPTQEAAEMWLAMCGG